MTARITFSTDVIVPEVVFRDTAESEFSVSVQGNLVRVFENFKSGQQSKPVAFYNLRHVVGIHSDRFPPPKSRHHEDEE